ncbi:MAG: double zinc ribbon domain-containing protein [Thermoplasmatota archaeon]
MNLEADGVDKGEEDDLGFIDVLIECPFCGGFVPDDFQCLKCGAEIFEGEEESVIYVCSECREEVDEDAEKCPHCGTVFE